MASELFWFYDICVLGIGLIYLYAGGKRGLMRSVVLAILTVASVAVSWLLCEVASPIIYESFIKEPIMTALEDSSSKTDPVVIVAGAVSGGGYGVEMTDSEVEGVITKGGNFFKNIAEEIKGNGAGESSESIEAGMESSVTESMLRALVGDVVSPAVLTEILDTVSGAESSLKSTVSVFLKGDRSATAEAVESALVAPAVKAVLKGIIWIAATFILLLVSRIVADAFKGLNKIPIIGPINSLLGAALGLAEGAVLIYLLSQVVKLVCYFTSNSLMFLNLSTVEKTFIFKYFFDFDFKSVFK